MGSMRVLVVEDFEVLAAAIGTGLRREGMAVDEVALVPAIVRAIAIAHRAALTATARSEGGLDIEASFP